MKLGLGLYRHMLTPENFRFARQAGATHIVAHLVDYDRYGSKAGLGRRQGDTSQRARASWSVQELMDLKLAIEAEGLVLAAIENLDPRQWFDVLLDGPRKLEQLDDLKTIVRRLGSVGIPVLGYYFSLAGTWGQVSGPWARGGAESMAFRGATPLRETLIPNGELWNMTYDPDASPGVTPPVEEDELWARLTEFLTALVPVAEQSGVRLAAHPDDPPWPRLRGTSRLIYQPAALQRLIDLVPSPSNALEFCQGTVSEMPGCDIYEAISRHSQQGDIAYVHFRNVRGTAPDYREVFIDEGDVDMQRALRTYAEGGFDGVIIPDHTPLMSCPGPWHAGMAHALGYMAASLQSL